MSNISNRSQRNRAFFALFTLSSFLALITTVSSQGPQPTSPDSVMGRKVSKTIRFLSPLQSITLFPKDVQQTTDTPRGEFLPKFQAGLAAESQERDVIAKERDSTMYDDDNLGSSGEGWEKKREESDRRRFEMEDQRLDRAFDSAASAVAAKSKSRSIGSLKKSRSKYQFVGVVQPPGGSDGKRVKWYARKRPANSDWNLRLVHVNREAIIKDLYVRGKVDVYGEYKNTGKPLNPPTEEGGNPTGDGRPLIKGQYSIKPRSFMNLWNFSPKHFFTDSSGSFWRERRLNPGLYTDGSIVYESTYRYTDGKNGMKPISKLESLLKSRSIQDRVKTNLLRRLKEDSPDIVIEE